MLQFTANNELSLTFADFKGQVIETAKDNSLPQRMEGNFSIFPHCHN